MNTDVWSTGLRIAVDWIAFTVQEESYSVLSVMDWLGFSPLSFSTAPRGAMGYRSLVNLDGYALSILSDGNADMGIHVNISGSAVAHVLETYARRHTVATPFGSEAFEVADFHQTVLSQFLRDIHLIGQLSRLDIAIDDFDDHFKLADLEHFLASGQVVSKFRSYTNNIKRSVSTNQLEGGTIYFGSGSSDVRLRVYDKQLEHNTKHPDDLVKNPWVRWEFQLRNERADAFSALLTHENYALGQAAVSVLNNYIRIINLDDSNRSRCSVHETWEKFVGAVGRLKLYVHSVPKTLDDKRNWIVEQVLPTLTGIIIADGGMFDIITEHWDSSCARMKSDLLQLLHDADIGKASAKMR